jgi:hypothetical protein
MHGNPIIHNTFIDETMNAMLRRVAQTLHRSRMQERIFYIFDLQGRLEISPYIFGM